METTFISIHGKPIEYLGALTDLLNYFYLDLSLDARLLYTSQSIVDILGYTPQEVVGKSCWEYFHPDEIPFARAVHGRGVQLDKAAVLNYCQIKNRDGRWVGCECVFTIVHDFSQEIPRHVHEPRAALFLNRFTRTLTIMYATNGLADILGITAEELNGKSFYYCIQENCLKEAVKCLESAKANDSIAYLRFWFRDPRQDDPPDRDERMTDGNSSGDEDEGGVHLSELMDEDGSENAVTSDSSNMPSSAEQSSTERSSIEPRSHYHTHQSDIDPNSRSSSGNSTDLGGNSNDAIFDQPAAVQSSSSSFSLPTPERDMQSFRQCQIELEAVVSCTSDGLVVVLRKARPTIPQMSGPETAPVEHPYTNGLFASPWAADPMMPYPDQRPLYAQHNSYRPDLALRSTAVQAGVPTVAGTAHSADFMNTIRDVAVFAWALTGINGSLAQYSRGKPTGEAQPPQGLPIWNTGPSTGLSGERPNGNDAYTNGDDRGRSHDQRDDYINDISYYGNHNRMDRQGPWTQSQQQHVPYSRTDGHSNGVGSHDVRHYDS
ncbi:MAG: hypothetical protein Q9170_002224, partial [Blastenia crenularia]